MNFLYLLLAVCLSLFASAAARPAASSGECSVMCLGRNFWKGFEAGKVYNYNFAQEMNISSGLNSQKRSILRAAGSAAVQVISDCEMQLTVQLKKSVTDNVDKQMPTKVADALKLPLRFAFEDGAVASICPSSQDSRESLNFKRAILSQLNLGVHSDDQIATIVENDILGSCRTEYSQIEDRKLVKVKDLSTCRNSFSVFPKRGVKLEPSMKASGNEASVQKGSVRCEIMIDQTKDFVRSSICMEQRLMLSEVGEKKSEKVMTSSKLTLVNVEDAAAAASPVQVESRSTLHHQHKTRAECQQAVSTLDSSSFEVGGECLEKEIVTSAEQAKAAAIEAADELCKVNGASPMAPVQAYAALLKKVRAVTKVEDLVAIINRNICVEKEQYWTLLFAAMMNAGTEASSSAVIKAMKNDRKEKFSFLNKFIMNSFGNMAFPTKRVIKEIFVYAQNMTFDEDMGEMTMGRYLPVSMLIGRYCEQSPQCENEEEVKSIIEFFSEKLGKNCKNLNGNKPEEAEISLFSISNIGRVAGGADTLMNCAQNEDLSLASRTFALRALRRFPILSEKQLLNLNSIFGTRKLDTEIRVVAFQILFKFADREFRINEKFITQLSALFEERTEDHQVQNYVFSFIRNWMRKTNRQYAEGSIQKIISKYERIFKKEKRSGFGYSQQWYQQFSDKRVSMKLDVDSDIIYSTNAMLPRFVNLNLSVASPLSGEAVNIMEFGLRTEGVDKFAELAFNALQSNSTSRDLFRKRRQVKMTAEQEKFKQAEQESRIDFFARTNGMHSSHTSVVPGVLKVIYDFIHVGGNDAARDLALEYLKFPRSRRSTSISGGTAMESTLVVPTITGFPILVKKEIYYSSDITVKLGYQNLKIQPKAAVLMTRTVSIDASFERPGIQTKSSILTDTGFKVFVTNEYKDPSNMKLQFGVETEQQKQQLLDLQTEVVFFSHNEKRKIETEPVISKEDAQQLIETCTTNKSMNYFGGKFCVKSSFGSAKKSFWLFRQTPGQYSLSLDMDKDFKKFVISMETENSNTKQMFRLFFGDRKNPKWLNMLEMSMENQNNKRTLNLEMANPVFPIKWKSVSDTAGNDRSVSADLKFGSAEYKFTGSRKKMQNKDWKLNGKIELTGSEKSQILLNCKYGYHGLVLGFLPMTKFNLNLGFSEDKQFIFKNLLLIGPSKSQWNIEASYHKGESVVSSYKSRVIYNSRSKKTFINYDTEIKTQNGQEVQHSMALTLKQPKSDTYKMTLAHKFLHGYQKSDSMLDFRADVQLKTTGSTSRLHVITGEGSIEFNGTDGKKVATISNIGIQFGDGKMNDFGFSEECYYLSLSYGLNYLNTQSGLKLSSRFRPINKWTVMSNYFDFVLNVTNSASNNLIQLQNAVNRESMNMRQIFQVIYADNTLVNINHQLSPVDGTKLQHSLIAQYSGSEELQVNNNYQYDDPTLQISSSVMYGAASVMKLEQMFMVNLSEGSQLIEATHNSTILGVPRYMKFEQKIEKNTIRNQKNIMKYLETNSGVNFGVGEFILLLWKSLSEIQQTQSFILKTPSVEINSSIEYNFMQQDGVCFRVTRQTKNDFGVNFEERKLYCKSSGSSWRDMSRQYTLHETRSNVTSIINSGIVLKVEDGKINCKQTFSLKIGDRTDFGGEMDTLVTYSSENFRAKSSLITSGESQASFDVSSALNYQTTKPYTSFGIRFSNKKGENIALVYNLTVARPESDKAPSQFNSTLSINNSFPELPFNSVESVANFNSNDETPFSLVYKNTLNGQNILNFTTSVSSKQNFKFQMVSLMRQLQQIEANLNYNFQDDGFINYGMLLKGISFDNEFSYSDDAKMKINGPTGDKLFFCEYNGTTVVKGLNLIVSSLEKVYEMPYYGLTDVKRSGDYDFSMIIRMIRDGNKIDFATIESAFNRWPLKISSKVNSDYWKIGKYGFLVSAGPREGDNSFAAKLLIQEPNGTHLAEYMHDLSIEAGRRVLESKLNVSSSLIASDQLAGSLNFSGSAFNDMKLSFSMRTPFDKVSELDYQVEYTKMNQSVVTRYATRKPGLKFEYTPISIRRTVEKRGDNQVAEVMIRSDLLFEYIRSYTVKMNYTYGKDYTLWVGSTLGSSNYLIRGIWLRPNSDVNVYGLPVRNANLGLQVTFPGYKFYSFRSGSATKYTWNSRMEEPKNIKSDIDVENNRITSGNAAVGEKKLSFSSTAAGSVQITVNSSEGSNSISWKRSNGGIMVTFLIGDKKSCVDFSRSQNSREGALKYGNCDDPFVISWNVSSSGNVFTPSGKSEFKIEWKTPNNAKTDEKFYLLPGYSYQSPNMPFSIIGSTSNGFRKIDVNFDSMDIKYMMQYDFTSLPKKASYLSKFSMNGESYIGLDYDVDANQLDARAWSSGYFNASVNMKSLLVDLLQLGFFKASYSSFEEIDLSWSKKAMADGEAYRLLLAKKDIANGKQFSALYSLKDDAIVSFVTNATDYKMDFPNFQIAIESDLRTTLHPLLKKIVSKSTISNKYNTNTNTYVLNYNEKMEKNDEVIYDLVSQFKGSPKRMPVLFNIESRSGKVIGNFTYDLQSYPSVSAIFELSKIGSLRTKYFAQYLIQDINLPINDFSFEYTMPNRNFFIGQSNKQLQSGAEEAKFEIFVHKVNGEGIVIKMQKDFTQSNIFNRTLLIELPTRTVGYSRSLIYDGSKTRYNLAVFWQYPNEEQNTVRVNFVNQYNESLPSWSYYQSVTLRAPFLKNDIQKQMELRVEEDSFIFNGSSRQGPGKPVMVLAKYSRYWDDSKSDYQRVFNSTLTIQDIEAKVSVFIDSESLRNSASYSTWKYLTQYRIYTVVPSRGIDSFIRIRSVPYEELSYACNHGATFALRFTKIDYTSRMSIFVSNSNKQAGQLTLVRDRRQPMISATLNSGKGYVNPSSSLSIPFYEPEQTLVQASAGVSKCGTKMHFGVMVGEVPAKVSYSLWKPSSIHSDVDFFFVGLKLHPNNTISYSSYWRLRREIKSSARYLKENLIDPWAKYGTLPIDVSTINYLLNEIAATQSDNLDTGKLISILTDFMNDIDQLKIRLQAASDSNEFFINLIRKLINLTKILAAQSYRQNVNHVMNFLPKDLGIQSAISSRFDAAAAAAEEMKLSLWWKKSLYFGRKFVNAFSSRVNYLMRKVNQSIGTAISGATNNNGGTIADLFINALSPSLRLRSIIQKRARMLGILLSVEQQSLSDTFEEMLRCLTPLFIQNIPDVKNVTEFVNNLDEEITQWEGFFSSETDNDSTSNSEASDNFIANLITEFVLDTQSPEYENNVIESIAKLFTDGVTAAIKQFFRTDAFDVKTWKLSCKTQQCPANFYAEVEGIAYSPIYISSFRIQDNSLPLEDGLEMSTFQRLNTFYQILYSSDESTSSEMMRRMQEIVKKMYARGVVSDSYVITFSNERIPVQSCELLLVNDFNKNKFSIVQTFKSTNAGMQRNKMIVNFFDKKLTIDRDLTVNDETNGQADIESSNNDLTVRFHSNLKNLLIVRCEFTSSLDGCMISVHPLYKGRVNGALGSNDLNNLNDVVDNDPNKHEQLWSIAACPSAA